MFSIFGPTSVDFGRHICPQSAEFAPNSRAQANSGRPRPTGNVSCLVRSTELRASLQVVFARANFTTTLPTFGRGTIEQMPSDEHRGPRNQGEGLGILLSRPCQFSPMFWGKANRKHVVLVVGTFRSLACSAMVCKAWSVEAPWLAHWASEGLWEPASRKTSRLANEQCWSNIANFKRRCRCSPMSEGRPKVGPDGAQHALACAESQGLCCIGLRRVRR